MEFRRDYLMNGESQDVFSVYVLLSNPLTHHTLSLCLLSFVMVLL